MFEMMIIRKTVFRTFLQHLRFKIVTSLEDGKGRIWIEENFNCRR